MNKIDSAKDYLIRTSHPHLKGRFQLN
jgi:hypothetical protein